VTTTRAPAARAIVAVWSVLPESSTSTSSAKAALAMQSAIRAASFLATMTTASESFGCMS
jgi:hypothetical protein